MLHNASFLKDTLAPSCNTNNYGPPSPHTFITWSLHPPPPYPVPLLEHLNGSSSTSPVSTPVSLSCRNICRQCKCLRELHDIYHGNFVNVRERLGWEEPADTDLQANMEQAQRLGYSWVPPGLTDDKVGWLASNHSGLLCNWFTIIIFTNCCFYLNYNY